MISTKTFDAAASWMGRQTVSALFNDVASRASSAVDALLAPAKVIGMGNIWGGNPVILPDSSTLFGLAQRGLLDPTLMRDAAARQGINLGWKTDTNYQRNASTIWSAVYDATADVPGVSFIMDCWGRGYFEGRDEEARRAIKRAGGNDNVWPRYKDAFYVFPAVGDLAEARNRGFISQEQWTEGLKRNGYGLSWTRTMFDKMLDRIPGPSDLIHFAVKEAFDVDTASKIGLYDEFPTSISPYMKGQGLGWELDFYIVADKENRKATVPDLYWAAHWQPISPSQAIDMYHLLRPNRLQRYRDVGINVDAFGLDDVKRWLKINDYPASVREQLVSLSFTPLRLVDIRSALTLGYQVQVSPMIRAALPPFLRQAAANYNREWGIEQFRDRGVLPEDANTQVDLVYAKAALAHSAPVVAIEKGVLRKSFRTVLELYRMGVNNREDSETLLLRLGLSTQTIGVYLDAEEKTFQLQRLTKVLGILRKSFLGGQLGADKAIESLIGSGIVPQRARDYVTMWATEATYSYRQATTEKILGWVAKGSMTAAVARQRLVNLGWLDPDAVMLLAEAQGKLLTLQGRAIKAADSERKKRAAELMKVQRDLEKQANLVQGALRRQTPVSTLQRWLKKGLISSSQMIARLQQQGYSPDVARNYARDAVDSLTIPTLQRWVRKKEISQETFLRHLATKGIDPDTAHKWLVDALTPEPPKPAAPKDDSKPAAGQSSQAANPPQTPVTSPNPAPTPEGNSLATTGTALHTTPEELNVQPEQLHTLPGRLGEGNPGGEGGGG